MLRDLAFEWLGFADTATILAASQAEATVLTVDTMLHNELLARNVGAINLHHEIPM